MSKGLVYVTDTLAYFVLSIISVIVSYSNLTYVEEVVGDWNVFNVYAHKAFNEYMGYFIMFIATGFLLYYIYRVNIELVEQGVLISIVKEIALIISLIILVGIYTISPFIFMVELPNQVLFTSPFSQILNYIIMLLPFVFYIVMLIVMIVKKIKG